ncbi:hypothetical protein VCR3J2_410180 [Vibrio coralliirubri]|nr:hypothetical protein VCR3J2_410180 [Vibrio coralliirubri]
MTHITLYYNTVNVHQQFWLNHNWQLVRGYERTEMDGDIILNKYPKSRNSSYKKAHR